LIKPEHLVFEIHKNITSSQTIKRYTQNQSLKWIQRTMKKKRSHFYLATGQFLFSKYKTMKRLPILNDVCWVFDQKAGFSKDLFQN